MDFKELTNGVRIPVLGLGTWLMGGGYEADTSHDEEAVAAIKTAIRLGMTHIDTAESYGNGHAEELVGDAVREFRREHLFITTKVRWNNLRYSDVISAAKRSLKRLRTSYVDLYLIHAPNPDVPVEETMRAMAALVDQRLTRFIGVSNFSVDQLKEAQQYTRHKIVANQIEYSLLYRETGIFEEHFVTANAESKIIPYCQENGIMVIAYRPLARGELAKPGIKVLDEIAARYAKTPAQVALNWLISKPNIVTIAKASKIRHLKDNLGAVGWRLSDEDVHKLDHDFPRKG